MKEKLAELCREERDSEGLAGEAVEVMEDDLACKMLGCSGDGSAERVRNAEQHQSHGAARPSRPSGCKTVEKVNIAMNLGLTPLSFAAAPGSAKSSRFILESKHRTTKK